MPTWDPARYLQFADDRTRPFLDLLAQIPIKPATIIDLGCGAGTGTKHLRARWPDATVLGVDSSAPMIDTAIADNTDALANYDVADISVWSPPAPAELLISNAVFQWVPNQFEVIDRLLEHLTDSGTFAVQVPDNSSEPTHTTLSDLAELEPYRAYLSQVSRLPRTHPEEYLEFFAERGFEVNAWSTTYLHVLHGPDPVFDWTTGSGARPYLDALPNELRGPFSDDLKARLREAYPSKPCGTLLPFRRTFAVATR